MSIFHFQPDKPVDSNAADGICCVALHLHYQDFPLDEVTGQIRLLLSNTTGLLEDPSSGTKAKIMKFLLEEEIPETFAEELKDPAFYNKVVLRLRASRTSIDTFVNECLKGINTDLERWKNLDNTLGKKEHFQNLSRMLTRVQKRMIEFLDNNCHIKTQNINNLTFEQ